jgi:hypothetical protein
VTTPGEVARQIMQQIYTKATFHPRLDHFAPKRPKTLTVESTKLFQRRPNPLGLTWRQHPTNWSPRRARPSRTQPPSMRATSTAISTTTPATRTLAVTQCPAGLPRIGLHRCARRSDRPKPPRINRCRCRRTDARHSRVPGETNLAKERFGVGHQGLLLGAARPGYPVEVGGPARPLVERARHALVYALEDG